MAALNRTTSAELQRWAMCVPPLSGRRSTAISMHQVEAIRHERLPDTGLNDFQV
jgi:hypothetical protein